MEVISCSIDTGTKRKMAALQDRIGFEGRSEMIRTAIDTLHREVNTLEMLDGETTALIVARHSHAGEDAVARLSHDHADIIRTQLHSKVGAESCLEVFQVDGDGDAVRRFYTALKGTTATERVDILPQ